MVDPVDPGTFKLMLEVYQAAASMAMPTRNPEDVKIGLDDAVVSFTDSGLNRGMLEVSRQLQELGVQNRQAYVGRLMCFDEILEAADRFGDLMQLQDDGGYKISDHLLDAVAAAKFYASRERLGFDIDDVVRMAREKADAEGVGG